MEQIMTSPLDTYLLASDNPELERLRSQARLWEPEAEIMLDRIGVSPGWHCLDLGCGAMGILGPLSQRVRLGGNVVGLDADPAQIAAAHAYIDEELLDNVELVTRDAYDTRLPRASFDLVHVRFVFAPVGRDEALLREMLALTRPGGVVAIQEPDAGAWGYFPATPAFERLKGVILAAFREGGGDFNAGRRTYGMLRLAGLEDVQVRVAVLALPGGHPYLRLPLQFAHSLRARIVGGGLMSAAELDRLVAEYVEAAADPQGSGLSFVVTQVWGRKPEA